MNWFSYYIYYYDYNKQDKLIIFINNILAKEKHKQKIQKWFFIRYWWGGPHIRLRILSERAPDKIVNLIQQYINKKMSNLKIDKYIYYNTINLDAEGEKNEISQLPWFDEGIIKKVPYIPENSRYGGKDNIDISETLFMYSSKIVAEIINNFSDILVKWMFSCNVVQRIAEWMDKEGLIDISSSEYLKKCFDSWSKNYNNVPDNLKFFYFSNYEKNANHIRKLVEQILYNNKDDIIKIKELILKLHQRIKSNKYFRVIVFHHIHMFNNRLGISPLLECEIYDFLTQEI